MRWRERSAMQEKIGFVLEWLVDGTNVTDLCKPFRISRTLGYAYIRSDQQQGWKGLVRAASTPARIWNRTDQCVESDAGRLSLCGHRRDAW